MKNVGDSIKAGNANWSFKGTVVKNFDKHISKSVPLYKEGHNLILKISDFFLGNGSLCYDLGCSTGELARALATRHCKKRTQFIGVDNEPAMAKETKARCRGLKNVKIINSDILGLDFKKADLIISYYTMQFIKPKSRQVIFNRIYNALNWGGGFLLFEKVRAPDARFQDMMTTLYNDFKIDIGYKAEEIISKTRSLKGVLEPFSTKGNIDLLSRAGFVDIMTVIKYICFEGFLAIK